MSKYGAPSILEDAFGSPNYDKELMKAFLDNQRKLLTFEPRHLSLDFSSSLPSSEVCGFTSFIPALLVMV